MLEFEILMKLNIPLSFRPLVLNILVRFYNIYNICFKDFSTYFLRVISSRIVTLEFEFLMKLNIYRLDLLCLIFPVRFYNICFRVFLTYFHRVMFLYHNNLHAFFAFQLVFKLQHFFVNFTLVGLLHLCD